MFSNHQSKKRKIDVVGTEFERIDAALTKINRNRSVK